MPTDDERREVARRLRDVARAEGGPLGDIGFTEAMHRALGGDGWRDMTARFADLIEPSESGQNRDRNQDTVSKESPDVQKAPGIDRDALLETADKMRKLGDEESGPASYAVRCAFRVLARDIYKALGEVVA